MTLLWPQYINYIINVLWLRPMSHAFARLINDTTVALHNRWHHCSSKQPSTSPSFYKTLTYLVPSTCLIIILLMATRSVSWVVSKVINVYNYFLVLIRYNCIFVVHIYLWGKVKVFISIIFPYSVVKIRAYIEYFVLWTFICKLRSYSLT